MFRQLLLMQWKTSRAVIGLAMVGAFAVPLGSVLYGSDVASAVSWQVASWLSASRSIGASIPYIALGTGVLLGMMTWSADQSGKHVYALSLPLERWQFILMRFGAGMTLATLPVVTLAVSALIASAVITLPSGVHAYPLELTLRFGLTLAMCYAMFFAISIATRRAVLLTLGIIGGTLVADLFLTLLDQEPVVVEMVLRLLTRWPGPLSLLLGRWALFDV